jgi:hypothetical protein
MPVTKSVRECYEVREDNPHGEWANITLHCWSRLANRGTKNEGTYYCGEITIQSSFGTWGYIWTACANPFKVFLQQVEFGYVFTKFMGTNLDRFDGEASAREVLKSIIEERRRGYISKANAREAWDAFEDVRSVAECSEHDFGTAMMDVARGLDSNHPLHDLFADPCGWPKATKYDAQAQGFWRQLWPLFVAELHLETAPAACAA